MPGFSYPAPARLSFAENAIMQRQMRVISVTKKYDAIRAIKVPHLLSRRFITLTWLMVARYNLREKMGCIGSHVYRPDRINKARGCGRSAGRWAGRLKREFADPKQAKKKNPMRFPALFPSKTDCASSQTLLRPLFIPLTAFLLKVSSVPISVISLTLSPSPSPLFLGLRFCLNALAEREE